MYTITWGAYLTDSIAILIFYYGVVFLLYYRKGLSSNLLKPFALSPQRGGFTSVRSGKKDEAIADQFPVLKAERNVAAVDSEAMFPQVHDLVDELQAYIQEAGQEEIGKEEAIGSIKKIVQKYPLLRDTPFQKGIRNLVAATVDNHCAFRLSADELAGLWTGETA